MNDELFELRRAAHEAFDVLWRTGLMLRGEAYDWLAIELGVLPEHCHIRMFSKSDSRRVVVFAEQKVNELRRERDLIEQRRRAKKHAKSIRQSQREARRVVLAREDDFAQFRRDKRTKRKFKREHRPYR